MSGTERRPCLLCGKEFKPRASARSYLTTEVCPTCRKNIKLVSKAEIVNGAKLQYSSYYNYGPKAVAAVLKRNLFLPHAHRVIPKGTILMGSFPRTHFAYLCMSDCTRFGSTGCEHAACIALCVSRNGYEPYSRNPDTLIDNIITNLEGIHYGEREFYYPKKKVPLKKGK
jgi:hypothetical protein